MRIFMTGATGFAGESVARELIAGGHDVIALVRSRDDRATQIEALGAKLFEGSVSDLDRLTEGAADADAVAHLAFNHDFSQFVASAEHDRKVVHAFGEAMTKTGGALLVTSGTMAAKPKQGKAASEKDEALPPDQMPRAWSEIAVDEVAASGVRAFVLRPAHIHDVKGNGGALAWLLGLARETGVSAYVEDGEQRWPGIARPDAATLYRLALEKGAIGHRYHGVTEEGVRMRDIAEAIGRLLNVPVRSLSADEAGGHFGPTVTFVAVDAPASGTLTREWLGWNPTGNGMIADIDAQVVL